MFKIIFWFSIATIVYTYAGYPALLAVAAWVKRAIVSTQKARVVNNGRWPSVSIIIPVFNERRVIRQKLENCLSLDYPKKKLEILVASDGSTDGTNEILRGLETKHPKGSVPLRIFITKRRQGKPLAINKLVKAARGNILFFTDARQTVEKDAVRKLVKHFEDREIGCVSGELVYERDTTITGRGIGIYWKYEKRLREMESDIYSMIGATGAIYACRSRLFEPLPQDIILDDLFIPFTAVKKGYRAIFSREARVYDIVGNTPRDEHKRKIRTLSGNYQIFFRMPFMLNPFKSKIALQIISHKLLRVMIPFFMVALLISNVALLGNPLYNVFLAAQAMFYGIALVEAFLRKRIKKIFGIPYLFCLLNFSALMGFWTFLLGRSDVKWHKART